MDYCEAVADFVEENSFFEEDGVIYSGDLKEYLKTNQLSSDKKYYDIGIAEYLLNPLAKPNNSFTLNKAKEYLDKKGILYSEYTGTSVDEIGLAVDTWDTEFKQLDSYRGINANMHTVEAFLAVADAINNPEYRIRAGRIIERIIELGGI